MRVRIETPFETFDADTLDLDPDLDGDFDVMTEDGEPLTVHGWQCEIEVLNAEPCPAGWYVVAA